MRTVERFSLRKARDFQKRFTRKPQTLLGRRGIYWVPQRDYDELDDWFGKALDQIEDLRAVVRDLRMVLRKR